MVSGDEHTRNSGDATQALLRLMQNGEACDIQQVIKAIDDGADINAKNSFGVTLLHHVAAQGDYKVTELLLMRGANINAKDNQGNTPLHKPAGGLLLPRIKNPHQEDVVKLLLEMGADANAKNNSGFTPLHWAAADAHDYTGIVELLIANGADVNARSNDNASSGEGMLSPLHNAAEQANTEIAKLLVARGADVNVKSDLGETPLHFAVDTQGNTDIVKLLVEKGADVNAKSTSGDSLLHLAASGGHTIMFKANVMSNNVDTVKLLLEKGADVNVKNDEGKTPVDIARKCEQSAGIECLTGHSKQIFANIIKMLGAFQDKPPNSGHVGKQMERRNSPQNDGRADKNRPGGPRL